MNGLCLCEREKINCVKLCKGFNPHRLLKYCFKSYSKEKPVLRANYSRTTLKGVYFSLRARAGGVGMLDS